MLGKTGVVALQGRPLMAAITSVCSAGFLLFGYDQGVMSGVVISQFWLDKMGDPSALIIGTITASYDLGAVVGAIVAAFIGDPLGRKRTLIFGALALLVGSVLMGSSFQQGQFIVGRIFTGIGIGVITSVTPVYQSEVSKASHRGWHVCCQLTTLLFGLMLAYFINYGFFFHKSDIQWRFPLLFQLVFAVYILLLTPFLPDTPRWLMRHGDVAAGGAVLARLRKRGEEDSVVAQEKSKILEAIQIEMEEEGSWMDLFRSHGIQANKRFYLSLGIQFMQQMTGINIVTYYAPTLFQSSLKMSQQMAILMGCFLQLWYMLASFMTWFLIDRIGRRPLFMYMGLFMCLVLVAEAVSVNIQAGDPSNLGSAISAVFWIFMFEMGFTLGWMATVWVYPPEILPLKIRAKGAALAAGADFLGNFLVVEITPYGIQNIGWKFYLVWAVLNLVNAIIVWMFYPETAGQPLEAIDAIFMDDSAVATAATTVAQTDGAGDGDDGNDARRTSITAAAAHLPPPKKSGVYFFQWSVVQKAAAQRKLYKSRRTSDATLVTEEARGDGEKT